MKQAAADHAKDWLTLGLTGLGISLAPHEWIGGMFLALAGAGVAMRMDPERDTRELWVVLIGAFLASHVAALCVRVWAPEVPVQIPMIAAGFFSRRITRFALRVAGLIEGRSEKIVDKLIDRALPEDKK